MKLIKLLTILFFVTLVLLASTDASMLDQRWYEKQFTKNEAYQKLDREQAANQTKNLFGYLQNEATLDSQYYTKREIDHLTDIKTIINFIRVATFISLAGLVGGLLRIQYREGKIALIKTLSIASVVAIGLYTSLGLIISFNFNQFFLILHQLSFRNNFWLLDPNTENLINIFPPELFSALGATIIAKAILAATITLILARLWLMKSKSKAN